MAGTNFYKCSVHDARITAGHRRSPYHLASESPQTIKDNDLRPDIEDGLCAETILQPHSARDGAT